MPLNDTMASSATVSGLKSSSTSSPLTKEAAQAPRFSHGECWRALARHVGCGLNGSHAPPVKDTGVRVSDLAGCEACDTIEPIGSAEYR